MLKSTRLFLFIFFILGCSQRVEVRNTAIANETTYSQYAEQFGTTSAIFAWASYYLNCISEVHGTVLIEQGIHKIFSSFFKSNSRIVNKAILKNSLYQNKPLVQKLDDAVTTVNVIFENQAINDEILQRITNSTGEFVSGKITKNKFEEFLKTLQKEIGGNIGKVAKNGEKLYVGDFATSAKNSIGDAMSPDHIPSFAALKKHFENKWGRSLSKTEENQLRDAGTTLLYETSTHQKVSRTYGGRNTIQQIIEDAQDLFKAAQKDMEAIRKSLLESGVSEEDVEKHLN